MEYLQSFLSQHVAYSPYILFLLLLLAGCNVPISIDLLLLLSAFIAAKIAPHMTPHLYISFLMGAICAAWISYWLGRMMGPYLLSFRILQKILPESRRATIERFLSKYGLITIAICRFIPFGVRNCLFFTSGITKLSFIRFAIYDLFACLIWSSLLFYTFYTIADNFDQILQFVQTWNRIGFISILVCVITWIAIRHFKKQSA